MLALTLHTLLTASQVLAQLTRPGVRWSFGVAVVVVGVFVVVVVVVLLLLLLLLLLLPCWIC